MKQNVRKSFAAAMLLVMTLGFSSCDGALDDLFGESDNPASGASTTTNVAVTSITLNETSLTKNLGDAAVKLTATVAPENATDKTVTWSSDNPAVATVNNGEVSVIGLGTAIITATANDGSGVKATCTVTVKFPGLLAGKFSVSDTQQVQFSQGNLQAVVGGGYAPDYYYASSWKFAEHQWDYLGYTGNNNHFGTGYSVDLFGWVGTNVSDAKFGYGLCTSTDDNDYGKPNNTLKSDWGTVIITNGGNTPNYGWRTLTKDEWVYLFARTTTSGICYAKATVNGKSGVILLPDDWSASYHALASANTANADFTSNPITAAEWTSDFEAHGAVFLPAAGIREGTSVSHVNSSGQYWSSTSEGYNSAYQVFFDNSDLNPSSNPGRHNGCSVRLVRDAE
ncbi:Ig-like domain (group 2) [Xylanibacter ruminicola]|uniref:Ig-like domain (Group 2) n=1 Tax=Xylanibacter ruminicola TaxID=839 RepID=A0A1H5UJG1_XYLRU|nr:Ig-like domain-containing protein [Xylanibacter ruminicola]SEF75174.1 Ig-like domain (group 2) [Xylanibacter ruminicola]